ncbi:hypothetical protein V5O48_005001 [Marasmius crinis-equi]|uniref:Uncharacterized protein n=1 Tax=Marasmius crinis-equi TaxID=585013 RepID=A0ABR3FNY2_9AGAR
MELGPRASALRSTRHDSTHVNKEDTGHLDQEEGMLAMSLFLEVLTTLPPTLAMFDLMGRLFLPEIKTIPENETKNKDALEKNSSGPTHLAVYPVA